MSLKYFQMNSAVFGGENEDGMCTKKMTLPFYCKV